MPTPVYMVRIMCENCGNIVRCAPVDAATFERIVEETDPALPQFAPDERVLLEEGDLTEQEEVRPVEVLHRYVAMCDRCAQTD